MKKTLQVLAFSVSISEVILHISTLKKYLDKMKTPDLGHMIAFLKVELESFKSLGENLATFLDTRFKSNYLRVLKTEKAQEKIMIE